MRHFSGGAVGPLSLVVSCRASLEKDGTGHNVVHPRPGRGSTEFPVKNTVSFSGNGGGSRSLLTPEEFPYSETPFRLFPNTSGAKIRNERKSTTRYLGCGWARRPPLSRGRSRLREIYWINDPRYTPTDRSLQFLLNIFLAVCFLLSY